MTPSPVAGKAGLHAGWILVTGLLALCVLGTWLTARNYRLQVFSSTRSIVMENQWPESLISAMFPTGEGAGLRAGQVAKITVGNDRTILKGAVVSVTPSKESPGNSEAIIRLVQKPGNADRTASSGHEGKTPQLLSAGAPCSVTVDTTVPPIESATPEPVRK